MLVSPTRGLPRKENYFEDYFWTIFFTRTFTQPDYFSIYWTIWVDFGAAIAHQPGEKDSLSRLTLSFQFQGFTLLSIQISLKNSPAALAKPLNLFFMLSLITFFEMDLPPTFNCFWTSTDQHEKKIPTHKIPCIHKESCPEERIPRIKT